MLTQSLVTQTTTSTTVTIKLTKGQPYSWYIISKSNTTTDTAESEKWKFYLKGDPVANYSPFPADLISPKSEATVSAGSIKFEWSGSEAKRATTPINIFPKSPMMFSYLNYQHFQRILA